MKDTSRVLLLFFAVLTFASGCGPVVAQATNPSPNFLPKVQLAGQPMVAVENVTNARLCSSQSGLKDFCVENFHASLEIGLNGLMKQFFVQNGPPVQVVFRVVQFSHHQKGDADPGTMPAVLLKMKWQVIVKSADGKVSYQSAETTESPETITRMDQANSAIQALLNAVLEKIGNDMNQSIETSAAPEPAPAAPPAPAPEAPAPAAPAP